MALFNKFFQSSKRKNGQTSDASNRGGTQHSTHRQQDQLDSLFPFSHDQVRIVLFRECDWTGRRLLFDSSAIQKVNVPPASNLIISASSVNRKNAVNNNNNTEKPTDGKSMSRHYIEVSNGYGYIYDATAIDSNSIGEMIFGSIAMSFRGTSFKVHWLSEPKRIMCSQVFLSPMYSKVNGSFSGGGGGSSTTASNGGCQSTDMSNCDSSVIETNSSFVGSNKLTHPLDVPLSPTMSTATTIDENDRAYSHCDSGFSSTDAWVSSASQISQSSSYWPRSGRSSIASVFSNDPSSHLSARKLSIDSAILVDAAINKRSNDGCMQRRILRNMSTSFENHFASNDFIGFFADHRNSSSTPNTSSTRRFSDLSGESRSNPEMVRKRKNSSKDSLRLPPPHFSSYTTTKGKSGTSRRSKIGLAVCITFSDSSEDEMQLFCSEHIALLESMLYRLRTAAESAYVNQKKFHQVMLHAWFSTTAWIADLFTAPRLIEPVWLTLSSGRADKPNTLAKHFMTELCWLLNCADTKDTNFFVSTLLTAILTNHLGWVGTVAPMIIDGSSSSTNITAAVLQSQMTEISKFHPYNVLWAQLGDLYGSIGSPSKLSKTIVCGTQSTTIRKVLDILTYFIRCGEIKRITSTKIIERDAIDDAINGNVSKSNICEIRTNAGNDEKPKGLSRTKTFVKDLTAFDDNTDNTDFAVKTQMNDIPNVLAFRDSRFVQQELRIGNFQMDTGIDMNPEQKMNIQNYKIKDALPMKTKIKLLITSPENDRYECEAAAEAIDYVLKKIDDDEQLTIGEMITANSIGGGENRSKTAKLLWNIEPVKEGIRIEQWPRFSQKETNIPKTDIDRNGCTDLKRSKSLNNKTIGTAKRIAQLRAMETTTKPPLARYASLSDLITANSVGASDRMQWGIEPVKEIICSEEEIYFDAARRRIESEHSSRQTPIGKSNSVVFVLGDNEVLSGLKSTSPSPRPSPMPSPVPSPIPSPVPPELETSVNSITEKIEGISIETVADASTKGISNGDASKATEGNVPDPNAGTTNTPKASGGAASTSDASGSGGTDPTRKKTKKHCTHKKHSGVKFNFEQYPQIVTNYMRSKNLDLDSYDFLEKGLKLEQENALNFGATSATTTLPFMTPEEIKEEEDEEEEEQCECCASSSRVLQTPSNATELEFNEDTYPVPCVKIKTTDTVSTSSKCGDEQAQAEPKQVEKPAPKIEKKTMDVIRLPIPKTKVSNDKNLKVQPKIGPGFVPSLFIGITDHYIADMVLQGTTALPSAWEPILKKNLALASHCAAFEQIPTENIAIIANVDKWDVKLMSSQSHALSGNGNGNGFGTIGMSQLVSSMLETVHAMWLAGSSAYQCMSFMESKLQEMYLQSETLAAFLLATEFCSLNSVTSALNLSANDVPLLLSVASIHSPQVTKKYGISFR